MIKCNGLLLQLSGLTVRYLNFSLIACAIIIIMILRGDSRIVICERAAFGMLSISDSCRASG